MVQKKDLVTVGTSLPRKKGEMPERFESLFDVMCTIFVLKDLYFKSL